MCGVCVWCVGAPLYSSERVGSDESGRGTEQEPVKSILQVTLYTPTHTTLHYPSYTGDAIGWQGAVPSDLCGQQCRGRGNPPPHISHTLTPHTPSHLTHPHTSHHTLTHTSQRWTEASQSQLKKLKKVWAGEQRKQDKAKERQDEDARKREENLEKAKSITITQDTRLSAPKEVSTLALASLKTRACLHPKRLNHFLFTFCLLFLIFLLFVCLFV